MYVALFALLHHSQPYAKSVHVLFKSLGLGVCLPVFDPQAVFQTLCRLRLTDHPDLPGRGLIITVRVIFDAESKCMFNLLRSFPHI